VAAFVRAPGVLAEAVDGKAALVNPEGTELITLNQVGTLVWDALAAGSPVEAQVLHRTVQDAFPAVEVAVIARDVDAFVAELQSLGLIAPA